VAAPWLDAYLNRIGVMDPCPVDVTGLGCLQAAHVEAIPFENLDILSGRGVHLDLARLRDIVLMLIHLSFRGSESHPLASS
jgi:arylamine N-acetyltransferase